MLQYISKLWNQLKLLVLNTIISKIHTLKKEDYIVVHKEGQPDLIIGMPKFAGNSRQRRTARREFIRHYENGYNPVTYLEDDSLSELEW
jgi:hypothetical protein